VIVIERERESERKRDRVRDIEKELVFTDE
jgi:hypothetical protein